MSRMRRIESEPCTVDCDTVAELLERIGWENAATLVRQIGDRSAQANREADQWRSAYFQLRSQYEPSEPREPTRDYRPPVEATG